jgi:transcriptional regulator with XRE-family HTH domain
MPRDGINPTDTHVGKRLRMRRQMLGLSQTKIAEALGLTFQQVQKYEKGANRIDASRLRHLSKYYKYPKSFSSKGYHMKADRAARQTTLHLCNM